MTAVAAALPASLSLPPPMPPAAPAGSPLARDRDLERDRPPPSQLVGHENLFGYWLVSPWAKKAMRSAHLGAAGSSLDALLQSAGLPLLSQPGLPDASGVRSTVDPNDSLLAMAFQAVAAPLPRHPQQSASGSALLSASASGSVSGLAEAQRRALTFSATSRDRGGVGPLQLSAQLDALVSHRAALLDAEERQARREKKRRKREAAAAARGPNVDVDGQAAGTGAGAGAHPSPGAAAAVDGAEGSEGRFKLTLSLGAAGKKRKAEGGATPADKQKRKKQELVV